MESCCSRMCSGLARTPRLRKVSQTDATRSCSPEMVVFAGPLTAAIEIRSDQPATEVEAIRQSLHGSRPYGSPVWVEVTVHGVLALIRCDVE